MPNWNEMLGTGASERQVDTWTRKGFLELDDRQDWARAGTPRLWTRWAYLKVGVMVTLTRAGILASVASQFCEDTEVKEDLLNGCKWVTGKIASGVQVTVTVKKD